MQTLPCPEQGTNPRSGSRPQVDWQTQQPVPSNHTPRYNRRERQGSRLKDSVDCLSVRDICNDSLCSRLKYNM